MDKCWCKELFLEQYGEVIEADCLEYACGRYRREMDKVKEGNPQGSSSSDSSVKLHRFDNGRKNDSHIYDYIDKYSTGKGDK